MTSKTSQMPNCHGRWQEVGEITLNILPTEQLNQFSCIFQFEFPEPFFVLATQSEYVADEFEVVNPQFFIND